jgi:hypothetical protein
VDQGHDSRPRHRQRVREHERIDRGELARPGEYDLISGLTGLGLYHLVRHGSAGSGMTAAVLDYLVALAEAVYQRGESLPGWWSGTGPAGTPDPAWPGGHLNLGMAHGIAGVLALLSGAMRVGIQVDGHAKAVSHGKKPPWPRRLHVVPACTPNPGPPAVPPGATPSRRPPAAPSQVYQGADLRHSAEILNVGLRCGARCHFPHLAVLGSAGTASSYLLTAGIG